MWATQKVCDHNPSVDNLKIKGLHYISVLELQVLAAYLMSFSLCSYLEEEHSTLIIYVNNQVWDNISVTVSARPLFKLLDGNVVFFWFKWLSSWITTGVRPGQTKIVNTVTSWNFFTHSLGKHGWWLYSIQVSKNNGETAKCLTPLHCTWIVTTDGIYQEEDPENRCRFKRDHDEACLSV